MLLRDGGLRLVCLCVGLVFWFCLRFGLLILVVSSYFGFWFWSSFGFACFCFWWFVGFDLCGLFYGFCVCVNLV